MKSCLRLATLFILAVWISPASAAPASSITQYGVTWTFDRAYESGQFATGDYWVVGPVTVQSVSPTPTATRNGSCVDPMGGRQGYDDRGGEFQTDDQVSFPHTFQADQSLVSSVSKPEGVAIQNAGNMVSQAVLTVVAGPQAAGALRPAFAGTHKRYFDVSQIQWSFLPNLPAPGSAPNGAQLVLQADRPRADHLSSWTIQNSCAEENWNNGPGAHACYGREVSAFISEAALYVMLDTPERDQLVMSLVQLGIDNYGILKAGGNWAPNGGHHSGRKWPIVFAAAMLNDCDMKAVGVDYDDSHFGEDGQTYFGTGGEALFGWDCGGGPGAYFESGCSGSGAKDCRDPAGAVDGCPDYRNCCTSSYWVGQMLSTLMLGAKSVWNHDPYFDYVDRWMAGDVDGADGSDAFSDEMWSLYRNGLPAAAIPTDCGVGGMDGGAGGATGGGGTGTAGGGVEGSGGAAGSSAANTGGAAAGRGTGGATDGGVVGTGPDGSAGRRSGGKDDAGCGCRLLVGGSPSALAVWLTVLAFGAARSRRRRCQRRPLLGPISRAFFTCG